MSVLGFEDFSYTYPEAAAPALAGVSLQVEPGEFVVVAGRSASGKSTLLRAACGLVPHFHGGVASGRAVVGGLDTREHGPSQLAAAVGTLLQDPETQIVLGTVRAELSFPLENRGLGAAAVARGVEEAALALGIERLLDRSTAELSGGELQRTALGAALAGRPQLLVLDEPTSQLDPVAGDELVWLLRRLNEEQGTAVLIAEHRLERCLAHADRVIALENGAIACDAPPSDFLAWAADHDPVLLTPAARLFVAAGLRPLPASVKAARAHPRCQARALHADSAQPSHSESTGIKKTVVDAEGGDATHVPGTGWWRRRDNVAPALGFRGVWCELERGVAVLRGVDLAVGAGERVALMGRNGAGKSTLLRHAAGLLEPTRGKVEAAGRVALLLQNPGDYLIHERVGDEASPDALEAAGLSGEADRHPRDLSGGQRQRLALAIVLDSAEAPAVVCLDEPTRGMDRAAMAALGERLRRLAAGGAAVIVATHDAEFAAAFAERVVLLADGRPIADAPVAEVLSGGWYFATETARILGGGALTSEAGAALLLGAGTVSGNGSDAPATTPVPSTTGGAPA